MNPISSPNRANWLNLKESRVLLQIAPQSSLASSSNALGFCPATRASYDSPAVGTMDLPPELFTERSHHSSGSFWPSDGPQLQRVNYFSVSAPIARVMFPKRIRPIDSFLCPCRALVTARPICRSATQRCGQDRWPSHPGMLSGERSQWCRPCGHGGRRRPGPCR